MPDQLIPDAPAERLLRRARRDEGGALNYLDGALQRDPDCAPALLHRAAHLLAAGRHAEARKDLARLEKVPTERALLYGEFDLPHPAAERILNALGPLGRELPWAAALEAFCLRSQMRFEEAVSAMQAAAGLSPKSATLKGILSRMRFIDTLPESADRDLDAAIELSPKSGWLWAWRGEAARQRGAMKEAVKHLSTAVKLWRGYGKARLWLGSALGALGKALQAEKELSAGLRMEPESGWGWHERFKLRRAQSRLTEALEDLRRAHALNPRFDWLEGRERGNQAYADAAAELETLAGRASWLWFWAAHCWLNAGRPKRALSDLAKARNLGLEHGWVAALRGRALQRLGRNAEAELARALRERPDYAPAWLWRGESRLAASDLPGAATHASRCLALDPVCAPAYLLRARAQRAAGRPQDAALDAARALRINTHYCEARELLEELLGRAEGR